METLSIHNKAIAIKQTVSGTLQAKRRVRIINQVTGLLTALPYYPGDRVKKGRVIARLDDSLLKVDVEKARATFKQAEVDYNRLKGLASHKLSSESELARAQTQYEIARSDLHLKQTQLSHSKIKAPITGVISQRLVEPGDVISLHSHLLTLIDTSTLKAEVNLSELLLPLVKKGSPVSVRIDALGKKSFKGKVKRIFPTINQRTHLGTVEITLSPVPKGALAGQFVRIEIQTESRSRLMIPYNTVRYDKQGAYVFTIENNKAKRVDITTGVQQDQFIEVIKGLSDKQQIISKGIFGLNEDMNVKVITQPNTTE